MKRPTKNANSTRQRVRVGVYVKKRNTNTHTLHTHTHANGMFNTSQTKRRENEVDKKKISQQKHIEMKARCD